MSVVHLLKAYYLSIGRTNLGQIFEFVSIYLGLLTSCQAHSIENLLCVITELLGVFLNFGNIESRGIHPCEIPQMGGHGKNMLVCSVYNLLISLDCHGLCLGSSSSVNLEKGSPYVLIYQWRKID